MNHEHSRRDFLRAAFGVTFLGSTGQIFGRPSALAEAVPQGPDSLQVGQVTLDREVYDGGGVLNGEIHFHRPPSGSIQVNWIDGFDRKVAVLAIPAPSSIARPLHFSFNLDPGLCYANWVRVSINGTPQANGTNFLLAPPPEMWLDYHVISWAHYPDGFYNRLRQAGIDGTIAGRSGDFSYILDNNFRFYVEQMAWEIFSIYIKRRKHWYSVVDNFRTDRKNLKLWIRKPCINDPKTDQYLREHLTRYVQMHRAFRPLYYNIADELGEGWQIKPNDFCHSKYCTAKFAEYLRQMYGEPGRVGRAWGVGEFSQWDDASRDGTIWDAKNLMISHTTTDGAFDAVAVAGLQAKYGSVARLNKEWGTSFPEPAVGDSPRQAWEPVMAVIRDTRSVPEVNEQALGKKFGSLEAANERWAGGNEKTAGFGSWSEVAAFMKRFYKELSEVRSTAGWNVAPWCDFRNFMDHTFADAVLRAAEVCKEQDPHARCGTEGGQSPFPFGWYNYEQVLRADDVIEPYNGGNNVEIIRSLKPSTIMVSTHGFHYTPGQVLTERQRLIQKQAVRPIWWGLFHSHRGSLIWDDNLPNYEFVDERTGELTPAAETFSAVFHELRKGIGKLFINAQRTHDRIAIYYSPPSDQIHWLLDNAGHALDWMLHNGSDRGSHAIAVRNSWTKVIEDLNLQYDFTSTQQVKAGKLNGGDYRVFIMPQAIAVSAEEVVRIKEFVRQGGLLIADCRAATMDGHGHDLGHGQLDEVFGIGHGNPHREGTAVRGIADAGTLRLSGRSLKLTVADSAVTTTEGKALARNGDVPLVVVNQFGKGRAIYLNLEVGAYCYDRLQADSGTSLPELMEGILKLAEIEPHVRVMGENGKRLRGTEVVIFKNGGWEYVAIFRNPQFDDAGWGDFPTMKALGWAGRIDNSLLERDAGVTIEWKTAQHTYDVRGKEDLGKLRIHKATLSPWDPLVFTRSEQAVPRLQLNVPAQVKAGSPLAMKLRSTESFPDKSHRVIRLELETPSGQIYDLYARNLLIDSQSHTEIIPVALNDPKGQWHVHIRDVMTGQMGEASFEVV